MDTLALTYKELAERLGVKPESARKLVQRKRWHRVTGNDGAVRIQVPVDTLPCPRDSTGDNPSDMPNNPVHSQIALLEAEITGLREIVQSERRRADEAIAFRNDLAADRDAWRAMAQRSWWKRLAG